MAFLPYRDANEILTDPFPRKHYDKLRELLSDDPDQTLEKIFEKELLQHGLRQENKKFGRKRAKRTKKRGIVQGPWGGTDSWEGLGGIGAEEWQDKAIKIPEPEAEQRGETGHFAKASEEVDFGMPAEDETVATSSSQTAKAGTARNVCQLRYVEQETELETEASGCGAANMSCGCA